MNIIVVGCGKVGSRLACALDKLGHDVCVVEQDERLLARLDNDFSGFTSLGVAIDLDVLRKAGIESCDALVAVTDDDNTNLMVSQLARELFRVKSVVARIYDPSREDIFSEFGLHTICPTNITVDAVITGVIEALEPKMLSFGINTVSFTAEELPPEFIGKGLKRYATEANAEIFGVLRENGRLTFDKEISLEKGDRVIVSRIVD